MGETERKAGGSGGKLGPDARDRIGKQLRELYDSVAAEPVPRKFLDLLENLEHREKRQQDEDPS